MLRVALGNLTAQLAADTAAAAGDHDHFSLNIAADFIQIDFNWVAAQQVKNRYLAQIVNGDFAVDQLIDAGYHLNFASGFITDIQDFLARGAVTAGDGVNDFGNIVALDGIHDFFAAAHNAHAVKNTSFLFTVVINQARNMTAQMGVDCKLAHQLAAGFACAYNHDIFQRCLLDRTVKMTAHTAQQPIGNTDTGRADKAEEQAQAIERAGHSPGLHGNENPS